MKKFSLLLLTLLVVPVFLLSACIAATKQPAVVSAAADPETLVAEGVLQPVKSLDQSFPIPGQVAEVLVKEGDSVKAGQVLAKLQDSPEAQLALARAQQEALAAQQAFDTLQSNAQVARANQQLAVVTAQKLFDAAKDKLSNEVSEQNQAQFDSTRAALKQAQSQLKKLDQNNGIDPDQLAAAQARLESAKAGVASAQAALNGLELKATLDGTVTAVNVQVGQRIPAGQPVITLADFSSWIVKTDNLTEMDVVKVKIGQKVTVGLDAVPGSALSGEVTQINLYSEEKRGDTTYTVTTLLKQTDPNMRWGMTAAVDFQP